MRPSTWKAGAATTVITKSGTNDLHGTGWWYHNNQHFNSDPVYFRSSTYVKPLAILNIFGGNLGGPIKKALTGRKRDMVLMAKVMIPPMRNEDDSEEMDAED